MQDRWSFSGQVTLRCINSWLPTHGLEFPVAMLSVARQRKGADMSAGKIEARAEGPIGWVIFDNQKRRNAMSLNI